ncbi:MAG: tRNA (5-methylaminomethyl-2-thiouridine)(34)-methyltransferase MnmD [Bacteroidia bacterium]|nr:tRNA (5-methylaminomethyl-2-thiouridine)(34)-methyltransferase MnmD [Bacteroidia bacterium]NNJ55510.1 tRNA (5-methylaminomethyl-2-thiouridine)(34)-methyltransferase MnmD [Bacteroidia bacterium]
MFDLLEIYTTVTGEKTLYIPEIDETYHSRNGAISESLHVFIHEGLNRIISDRISTVNIFEVGFGTGLNALITSLESDKQEIKTFFHTVEPYPVGLEYLKQLNYGTLLNSTDIFQSIHACVWEAEEKITPRFRLKKSMDQLENITLESNFYHCIFFDAFAPKKQPELWNASIFQKLYDALQIGGVLTTYSAAGQLKRDLKSVGFKLEHPPGANGKREMTVAIK